MNGCDVRDLDLQQLRSQIGLVSQEPVLFSSTVGDNISYGNPEASQQQVEDAARAANAHSFVSKLPEGYNTQVSTITVCMTSDTAISLPDMHTCKTVLHV